MRENQPIFQACHGPVNWTRSHRPTRLPNLATSGAHAAEVGKLSLLMDHSPRHLLGDRESTSRS